MAALLEIRGKVREGGRGKAERKWGKWGWMGEEERRKVIEFEYIMIWGEWFITTMKY